jgi:hypothetical protein
MTTKTQYFIIPRRSNLESLFLIKFDGQYSYRGSMTKKWIYDPTVLKQDWIDKNCIPITEMEANKIIKGKEPLFNYRRNNPKIGII